jgi:hypothetical protein
MRGSTASSWSIATISCTCGCGLPCRLTPMMCTGILWSCRAAPPPMLPTPMRPTVLPSIGVENSEFQLALRWLVSMTGILLCSISTAISAYSPALSACAPLLLVIVTPAGTQSIGHRCSTPAPMQWIHFSLGATCARFSVGRFQVSSISVSRIDSAQ